MAEQLTPFWALLRKIICCTDTPLDLLVHCKPSLVSRNIQIDSMLPSTRTHKCSCEILMGWTTVSAWGREMNLDSPSGLCCLLFLCCSCVLAAARNLFTLTVNVWETVYFPMPMICPRGHVMYPKNHLKLIFPFSGILLATLSLHVGQAWALEEKTQSITADIHPCAFHHLFSVSLIPLSSYYAQHSDLQEQHPP